MMFCNMQKKLRIIKLLMLIALIAFHIIACEDSASYPVLVEESYSRENKFPQIDVFADVKMDICDEFPVTTVEKRQLSYDEIALFIQYVGGNPNELFSMWTLSKENWQSIVDTASGELNQDKDVERVQDILSQNIEKAPYEVQKIPVKLVDLSLSDNNQVYCSTTADEPSIISFSNPSAFFSYFRVADSFVLGKGIYEDYMLEPDPDYDILWLSPVDPKIDHNVALDEAIRWVNKFDMELEYYSSEPCSIIRHNAIKGSGWKFVFTRKSGSLQASYEDGTWCYVNPAVLPKAVSPWSEEFCVIVIDEEGLFELWWQGASNCVETTTIHKICPFKQIKSKTINLLQNIYSDDSSYEHSLEIKAFVLEICLISSTKQNEGIYVPSWKIEFDNYYHSDRDSIPERGIIFINALTGEYIEPKITEEKLFTIN